MAECLGLTHPYLVGAPEREDMFECGCGQGGGGGACPFLLVQLALASR